MSNEVIKLSGEKKSSFMNKVMEILPDGGNLNLCLTQFISHRLCRLEFKRFYRYREGMLHWC